MSNLSSQDEAILWEEYGLSPYKWSLWSLSLLFYYSRLEASYASIAFSGPCTQLCTLTLNTYRLFLSVLVLYEFLITFDDEVRMTWRRPFTVSSFLFLLNRWPTIIRIALGYAPLIPQTYAIDTLFIQLMAHWGVRIRRSVVYITEVLTCISMLQIARAYCSSSLMSKSSHICLIDFV